jgi:hypothetical protein
MLLSLTSPRRLRHGAPLCSCIADRANENYKMQETRMK